MWGAGREMYTLLHDSLLQLPLVPPERQESIAFPVRLSPVVWMHVEVTEQLHSIWKPGGGLGDRFCVILACAAVVPP